MLEIFSYDFMINALIAGTLASIAFGVVGSYIVVKKISYISGGISHTAYGGIGLGYFLGFSPLLGAVGFSILAAIIIAYLRTKRNNNEDTIIGIMWSLGMALGILFISLTEGYAPNLNGYLFGNILVVPTEELYLMFVLDLVIVLSVYCFYDKFLAITFDEEFARVKGIKVDLYYLILLILIAFTTVVLIKLVGIILVIALLTIPGAISLQFVKSLRSMMILSTIIGFLFNLLGLIISYYLNISSGATIIIIAVISYIISLILKNYYFNKIVLQNKEASFD
ncbi:MAG TPA: metal ABC transporter permease [Melioribacteraceae bacterium]|nr:metal ABC transporter permease [Melioribacteraceae bacterium]